MEVEESSGVKRNSKQQQQQQQSCELARNSSITVTIDDLAEGLIVVSFAHSDNLYQGVLFQLNRERGIPSGISFAKEVVGTLPAEKADSETSQAPTLHQRHTYNQGSSSCYHAAPTIGTISQPSLRRVIKPPARFKNARMSLRLRARPVLCAKCRSLCDDKADSNGKEEPSKEESNQNQTEKSNNSKKERLKASKSSGEVTISTTTTTSLNGKLKGLDTASSTLSLSSSAASAPTAEIDPQDLSYESVRNKRIVENFWKRPLVQPLIPSSEETYASLRKHKAPPDANRERKRVKASSSTATSSSAAATSSSSSSSSSTALACSSQDKSGGAGKVSSNNESVVDCGLHSNQVSTNTTTLLTESTTVCDKTFPYTRSRKALNLKMCITKLTEMKTNGPKDTKVESTNNSWSSTVIDTSTTSNPSNSSPNHSDSSESTSVSSPNPTSTHGGKSGTEAGLGLRSKGSTKRTREWEDRIRKKSSVPMRYRDESYLTKNIFNFNKRRPLDGGEIPVLTICRSDVANTFKVSSLAEPTDSTVTTTNENDDENEEEEDEDDDNSSSTPATAPSCESPPQEESASNSVVECSSSPHSPTSSSNFNEVPPNFSIKSGSCKPLEMTKTPTIKITFGSSGNGMVVQIPPKATQHLECSSTTEMKAARKAMKKAKKEARRKRSLSTDLSPSCTSMSPDHTLKSERSNPPSPVTPTEPQSSTPTLPTSKDCCESSDPIPIVAASSSRVTKKKKKQKKRRRSSKVLKENDGFTSSSSSHDHCVAMSSPCSNSSLNQDFVSHGHSSPSGTSVKSCNFDSISNPDAHDSFQSFCKETCPPPRRRSVPASSTTSNSDAPQQRVCINLKRIDTNAYVPLPLHSISAQSDHEDPSSQENGGGAELDSDSEPNEFPVNGSPTLSEAEAVANPAESVDYYKDKETEYTYRKGDVIWGKLPACPWWPGKITDILTADGEDARAKISWYKSTTQSCIRFKMVAPFAEYFNSKYARSRRRGSYQLAVRDALVEAHKFNPEDLPTD